MISFMLRIWCNKLPNEPCLVHERNLQEMCLYISGDAAFVKTLRYGCMKYRALEEPSEITVRKRGYVVLLESTEIFEFCVVSMKIPNSRSRYQDTIYTANVNTRNERCEKKRSRFLSSAKRQVIEID